jgi:hypothetical protein
MTPRSANTFPRSGNSPLNATHRDLPEVIHGVYSIKQLQNEKRSLIQHSEPGLPGVWGKDGRSRQRVQVPGEMPDGLASALGWRPPNRTVVKWPAKQPCSVTLRSFLAIDRTIGTRPTRILLPSQCSSRLFSGREIWCRAGVLVFLTKFANSTKDRRSVLQSIRI